MTNETKQFYEFGPYRIDPEERLLFRGQEPIPLPPKAFETLLILVNRCERVVLKDDLMKSLWPDTFVEEANLSQNIFVLRKALGETAQDARYIITVPGRGYRFAAPVRVVAGDSPPTGAAAIPAAPPSRKSLRAVGLAVAAAAVLIVGYLMAKAPWTHPPARTGKRMIAVLPFQNLTGEAAQEFVADGMTEEMISQLGALNHEQLGVIARTSAMTYKNTTKPVDQIGRELGVGYVLEGSVRRWGDHVRITAQLVQTSDQTHLWAKNYEGDARDILKLQSEVAQSVAEEISPALTPEQRARVTNAPQVDPQVYELCLRGRYEWNQRTAVSLHKAVSYYQQAISRGSGYAPAYAGLANAYAMLPYFDAEPVSITLPKARAAAQHALQLDERLAEAHTALGMIEGTHFNWPDAEREYKRGLELNPNYATGHHWYSFLLWNANRREEAVAEMERAKLLDPLSAIISTDEARMFLSQRQTDRAIDLLRKVLEFDPTFAEAHRVLALAFAQQKDAAGAVAEARRGFELEASDSQLATLGFVYAVSGQLAEARRVLEQLGKKPDTSPEYLSFVHVGLSNNDLAIADLEQAYRRGSLLADALAGPQVMVDPIRNDPRFQDLLRRVQKTGNTE